MILGTLNSTQKAILLALVTDVVKADNDVKPIEQIYVTDLMEELKSDVVLVDDAYNLVVENFNTQKEKFILISTLLTVAFLDNVLHPLEVSYISQVAEQINFSKQQMRQIFLWAQREALQINEGLSFIAYSPEFK